MTIGSTNPKSMQDFIGSVRRSLVFKPSGEDSADPSNNAISNGLNGFVEKIGFSIRNSRIGLFKQPVPALPPVSKAGADKSRKDDKPPSIRWRKGELIGSGAFGRVYMGMNLDSGELLAIKEVSIAANSASKEKTKIQIRELEEEVNLLKNLSHPNIVRYLGTAREEESLNILLEFVPGGSISSLLGKFGSFPESVIRMYTKQLLLGLDYLHKNGIMHRDIKGANILVDNKGCIKLADFGASKKVVELATMTCAKSMKGTPYWMAPEVILQTGHTFSADIWSVGCTVIEMATGKPPWSQQYQEVAALFHIGTTKSHPPIPEHLSEAAKDFLLKCLQKEPYMRSTASDLLEHPFVTGGYEGTDPGFRRSVVRNSYKDITGNQMSSPMIDLKQSINLHARTTTNGVKDTCNSIDYRCSTVYSDKFSGWQSGNFDDDMCQIDDKDELMFGTQMKFSCDLRSSDCNKSFNPMSEPVGEWSCKFDESPELERHKMNLLTSTSIKYPEEGNAQLCGKDGSGFTFPLGNPAAEDDDEVTETKIREFLDEKALELKKLQNPLFQEFYNSLNTASQISPARGAGNKENISDNLNLPPKSKSPNRVFSRRFSKDVEISRTSSPGSCSKRASNAGCLNHLSPDKTQSSQLKEFKELLFKSQRGKPSYSSSFSERQRKWKEELDEELDRKREILRQAGVVKISSPKDRNLNRYTDQLGYTAAASPRK